MVPIPANSGVGDWETRVEQSPQLSLRGMTETQRLQQYLLFNIVNLRNTCSGMQ